MGEFLRKFDPIVHGLMLAGIVFLGVSVFYLRGQLVSMQQGTPIQANPLYNPAKLETTQVSSDSAYVTSDQVEQLISKALSEQPTPAPVTTTKTTTAKQTQTTYIPLGSTATSTSTDWYTVDDSSVTIDVANDFSGDPYITFEASLKVAYGQGGAFVRLWDDTHKIAVNGSELTTLANEDYQTMKSGRLYLWNGNNTYKVQIKSLNGYEASYTNGKVKVVY